MKAILSAIAALLIMAGARAAPLERDLGLGLTYWRVHALPGDLPTAEPVRQHPCVLDVRYVHGGAAAADALFAWLKLHASPRTPVVLLANADTSGALLAPLNSPDAVMGLVIIGPVAPNFTPDIALRVPPGIERRAYDALEKGVPLESLLTEKLDKPRYDEERLAREHMSDSAMKDDDADADKPAAPAPKPPQLMDPVLQRAVQLHRALLALKRI